MNNKTVASLKLSFFCESHVIKPDPNYQYALVTGNSKKFSWLLSKIPNIDDAKVKGELVDYAKQQGFVVEKLVSVKQ